MDDECNYHHDLGKKGSAMLRQELGIAADANAWSEKNHELGRVFFDHALLVSDVMVAIELACRKRGEVQLLYEDELGLAEPFQWRVKIDGGAKLGVIPDKVFALEYVSGGVKQRAYFFLEADRGTMPVIRSGLAQTSFFRKLLAYEATRTNKVHQRHLGIPRFRVLTVTASAERVTNLLDACSQLKRGHGLFLFADQSILDKDILAPIWQCGKAGAAGGLL